MSSIELHKNWTTLGSSIETAIANANSLQDSLFSFGVSYLDDVFHGVCRNDVILIGAPSGGGKTQLSTLLAKNFATQGKRTWMLALEAMKDEIALRICHSILGKEFGSYSDFLFKAEKNKRAEIIRRAIEELPGKDILRVFYKDEQFGISAVTREFYAMEGNCDVAILDYFQFVDLDGDKSEMFEQRELANEINRLQKILNIPVIILAQFNKAFTKSGSPFPTLADFYGTSALTNMCTKAITITQSVPETCKPSTQEGFTHTVIYTPKFRYDGSRSNFFAVLPFNQKLGTYEKTYLLCDAKEQKPISAFSAPQWAKNAKELRPY